MKTNDTDLSEQKKSENKAAQMGEKMVIAIAFMAASIILFVSALAVHIATKGQARAAIITQSVLCIMLLIISLALCFAQIHKMKRMHRQRIMDQFRLAGNYTSEGAGAGEGDNADGEAYASSNEYPNDTGKSIQGDNINGGLNAASGAGEANPEGEDINETN